MLRIIIGVLLFAIASAFVYAWGYVKEQRKTQELFNQLIAKSQEKILKEMKKEKFLTKKDIEKIIEGTKSSLFWSKNKMQVTDSKVFADTLIQTMLSKGLMKEIREKKVKKYGLNKLN